MRVSMQSYTTGHELGRQLGTGAHRSRSGPTGLVRSRSRCSILSLSTPSILEEMGGDSKIPLASQVGGHAGVSTSEDGSQLYKPALAHEVDFYQYLNSDPVFASLKPYIPKFYGVLRYEGMFEEGNLEVDPVAPKEGKDKCFSLEKASEVVRVFITIIHLIVLENLSHRFLKPNILDIKLGTMLYDDGASEEKKERMIKTAKNTTSFETGVRLTGFQVGQHAMIGVWRIFFAKIFRFCAILGL